MPFAPIAFFAYKRPEHTLRSLESLAKNEGARESELFIFCDGPKISEDIESVKEVRHLVKSKKWCGRVKVVEQKKNQGLAASIIAGVTKLSEQYGRVIVIEDDLTLSSQFLRFMNDALEKYKDEKRIYQISGYMFNIGLIESKSFFLPQTTSWGWATWHRAWEKCRFNVDGYKVLKNDRDLRNTFNVDGAYPYFEMLESQINHQIDSWAIRWYLFVFMAHGLTLYPSHSLVDNTGFDRSATHPGTEVKYRSSISNLHISEFPEKIEVDWKIYQQVKRFIGKTTAKNMKANDFKKWGRELLSLLRVSQHSG